METSEETLANFHVKIGSSKFCLVYLHSEKARFCTDHHFSVTVSNA